jgi:cytochrome c-type biogenesis protein CcmH/NrfG
MFVLLALVFALGFVFFGVGSGSTGISDALQNAFSFGHSSGGTSISKLQKKVAKSPQDAAAWRDLATALEQKQKTKDAVDALERYTALRPSDQGALAELAAQYSNLATTYSNDYAAAQAEAVSASTPGDVFAPPASTPFGKAFADPNALKDPISAAVSALTSTKQNTAYTNYLDSQRKAESVYQRLVKLNPRDATTQIQLGQAAQDTPTAIAAFEKFLKLAPTDPLVAQVKQALKSLRAQSAPAASASTSG